MRKKRIFFLNPSSGSTKGINSATVYPPIGLLYLASYLEKYSSVNDYEMKLVDANLYCIDHHRLLEMTKEYRPDIAAVHLNIILAEEGIKYCNALKEECPGIKICIGGPLVSSNPSEMLKESKADYAVIGEGEQTFLEICEGSLPGDIKGLAYIEHGDFIMNNARPPIEDMDSIPFPKYSLLRSLADYRCRARSVPVGPIITSRGCPYPCSYCSSSVFGKRFRKFSEEYVIREIDYLVNEYGIRQLNILDDNFCLDKLRASKILDLIVERPYRIDIDLENGIRVENIDKKMVVKMKAAGVFKVGIGIESGDNYILQKINKGIRLKDIESALRLFRASNIITVAYFIIGFPDEDRQSIEMTIEAAVSMDPVFFNMSLLLPMPGTAIYSELLEAGLLLEPSRLYYSTGFFENTLYHRCLYMDKSTVNKMQKKAYLRFYIRPKKIIDIISGIRSYNELKWALRAGWGILKDVIF